MNGSDEFVSRGTAGSLAFCFISSYHVAQFSYHVAQLGAWLFVSSLRFMTPSLAVPLRLVTENTEFKLKERMLGAKY